MTACRCHTHVDPVDPLIQAVGLLDPAEADALVLLVRLATSNPWLTPTGVLHAVTEFLDGGLGRAERRRAYELGHERGRRDVLESRCGPRPVPPPGPDRVVAGFEARLGAAT